MAATLFDETDDRTFFARDSRAKIHTKRNEDRWTMHGGLRALAHPNATYCGLDLSGFSEIVPGFGDGSRLCQRCDIGYYAVKDDD